MAGLDNKVYESLGAPTSETLREEDLFPWRNMPVSMIPGTPVEAFQAKDKLWVPASKSFDYNFESLGSEDEEIVRRREAIAAVFSIPHDLGLDGKFAFLGSQLRNTRLDHSVQMIGKIVGTEEALKEAGLDSYSEEAESLQKRAVERRDTFYAEAIREVDEYIKTDPSEMMSLYVTADRKIIGVARICGVYLGEATIFKVPAVLPVVSGSNTDLPISVVDPESGHGMSRVFVEASEEGAAQVDQKIQEIKDYWSRNGK